MIVERSGRAHTQQEIALYCGVSRAAVSQVETQALRRLRVFCAEKGIKLEDFASALGTEFK
jgi:DNA-directed RNA polymerase sigma subunit (sigma70/sigma32)